MVKINPNLRGFSCLRTNQQLPVDDYFEGSPLSISENKPANVRAIYEPDCEWPGRLSGRGIYRYKDLLPYHSFPTLGEGGTSLVELPRVAKNLDLKKVWLKNESQNPTGSHKDRLGPLVVARALDLGKKTVAAASSGNGGTSLAAYAAAAGLKCAIVTTDSITPYWKRALMTLGAELVLTSTSEERWEILAEKVRSGEWYPATNYTFPAVGSNPFGIQGYKTVSYELAEDLDFEVPDAIVVPTSRGDLLWGIYEGLRELKAFKKISKLPRLFVVEPLSRVTSYLEGQDYRSKFPGSTNLISIAGNTITYQMVEAVEKTKGGAVVVTDTQAEEDVATLGKMGFYGEGSGVVGYSALAKLRADNVLQASDTAVILFTSHGFKDGFRS